MLGFESTNNGETTVDGGSIWLFLIFLIVTIAIFYFTTRMKFHIQAEEMSKVLDERQKNNDSSSSNENKL